MGDVPGGLVNGNCFGSRSQAYLRMLARWRRTFLPALAFGRMLPPPRLTQRGDADTSGAVGLRLSVPSCGVGIFELTPAGAGGL